MVRDTYTLLISHTHSSQELIHFGRCHLKKITLMKINSSALGKMKYLNSGLCSVVQAKVHDAGTLCNLCNLSSLSFANNYHIHIA